MRALGGKIVPQGSKAHVVAVKVPRRVQSRTNTSKIIKILKDIYNDFQCTEALGLWEACKQLGTMGTMETRSMRPKRRKAKTCKHPHCGSPGRGSRWVALRKGSSRQGGCCKQGLPMCRNKMFLKLARLRRLASYI